MLGEPGIESPLVSFFPMGFELILGQPTLHRLFKSPEFGDLGIEFPMPVVTFAPVPWFERPVDPSRRPSRTAAALGGRIGFAASLPFVPLGFPEIFAQDLHPRREKAGTIMVGDFGIELPMPKPLPVFNFERHLDPLRRPHIAVAGLGGRIGFAGSTFVPLGFPEIFSQEPRRRFERAAAGMIGDPGTQATLIRFVAMAWPEPPMHKNPTPRPTGAVMRGDDGIEFHIVVPPLVTSWPEPPMFKRPTQWRAAAQMRGDDGTQARLVRFFPMGWEVQPPQPPHWPRTFRDAAVMLGDPGIQAPLIRFFPMGFEPTPPLFFRRPLPHVPVFLLDSIQEWGFIVPGRSPSSVCVAILPYGAYAMLGAQEIETLIAPYGAYVTLGAQEIETLIETFGTTVTIKREDCT
jgi:hypothetical protein